MKQSLKDIGLVALRAREFAYSPFSGFKVGAALLTKSGRVFTGCNVESSSYGLTVCAERIAVFKAISEGERDFVAIAVAADTDPLTPPCGACLQVLADHSEDMDIVLVNPSRKYSPMRLKSLLPKAFTAKYLKKHKR